MGLQACLDVLIGGVRALVPISAPDDPFRIEEDGAGVAFSLEDLDGMPRHREFDLRMVILPADDGEVGLRSRRLRVRLGLRMFFDTVRDRGLAERQMGEDLSQLALELPAMVLLAGAPAAGMQSIPPPLPATARIINDENGNARGLLAETPFDLIYVEI